MKLFKLSLIGICLIGLLFISGCSDYSKSQVCGTHQETYTSNAKGCDGMDNCRCLHESWGGLGSCDSCECTKEVSNC